MIWAGTNDGQVQATRDGGANWTNVTPNIPDLPPLGTVSNIEPSRYDAGTCYITVDFHQENNRDPFVYKTTDYGESWKSISSDIPRSVFSYAHCLREDPVRKGLLYLGTENALYVSFNDGENWSSLQNNMPHAPVHWMVVQEHFNDLVVGNLRARLLDLGRHHTPSAAHRRGHGIRHPTLRSSPGLPDSSTPLRRYTS